MKHFIILCFLLSNLTVKAQDITGQWNGVLNSQGIQLRIVFKVSKSENGYNTTMVSPDQSTTEVKVTKTTFENSKIRFEISNFNIEYEGILKNQEIIGTFKQNGQEFPMSLGRQEIEKKVLKRPQEPQKPFSYYSENVSFKNEKENVTLAGTLTLPKKEGIYPTVILITGSGPQNRDEEILGHKPFLVIANYLTKNGIAVLRYDDREVGESTGNFKTATSANFATDVESAIVYLKTRPEINKNKIGLIGHSEGAMIAPMIASKDKDVAFIILLAGPGLRGDKILLLQQELIAKVNGDSKKEIEETFQNHTKLYNLVLKSHNNDKLESALTNSINEILKNNTSVKIPKETKDEFVSMQVKALTNPWMQYFIKYNPIPALKNVKCPVLALNGAKDLQVPPKENLDAIKKALDEGGNKNVTIKELPELNHLFQTCKTGSPNEYAEIEETFSPIALKEILNWIKRQVK